MAMPFDVTDADFEEKVLKSDNPIMVDFWAEWCGPCRIVAPVVVELAEEYDGQMGFAKVDVDSNPKTAVTYGVRSIPTLLIFQDGKPVEQVVGAVPKSTLQKRIDSVLTK
jgi:thioredoxin 1